MPWLNQALPSIERQRFGLISLISINGQDKNEIFVKISLSNYFIVSPQSLSFRSSHLFPIHVFHFIRALCEFISHHCLVLIWGCQGYAGLGGASVVGRQSITNNGLSARYHLRLPPLPIWLLLLLVWTVFTTSLGLSCTSLRSPCALIRRPLGFKDVWNTRNVQVRESQS